MDDESDDGLRRHPRHLEDDARVAGDDFGLGQLRSRHAGHPGLQRRRQFQQRSALRRHAGVHPGLCLGRRFDILGNFDGWDPVNRDERTYAFASNLTKLHGAHEFRFGYSVNKLRMNHWQPELGYGPRGAFESASPSPRRSTTLPHRPRTSTTVTPRCCSAWATWPARACSTS